MPFWEILKRYIKIHIFNTMACNSCKDERWQISLKFDDQQKRDLKFQKSVRDFLEAMLLDRSTEQIKQMVEFAIMCETSIIAEDLKTKIDPLKEACFTHGIPIQVKTLRLK